MKKIIYIALIATLWFPHLAQAQVRGLLISPQRVVFEKGERVQEVRLVNRGDETQKYRVSIVNRRMKQNGQLEPAETPADNEFFADKVLRYGPRQVELGPKEAQSVRLMSRLTSSAADGEYRSHLLIQEIPDADAAKSVAAEQSDSLGVSVQAIFGISLPVFFRKGDLNADVSLSNPTIVRDDDTTYARFDINRSGNKSIYGTAKVLSNGKEIGILKGIAVYLSAPTRTISVEIPKEYAETIAGQNLRITFGAVQDAEDTPSAEVAFVAN